MKIQETIISDIVQNEAVVSMTLAGHPDLEQAGEYVLLKTYVPHEPGLSLEKIQLRALGQAAALIEKLSGELERRLPKS